MMKNASRFVIDAPNDKHVPNWITSILSIFLVCGHINDTVLYSVFQAILNLNSLITKHVKMINCLSLANCYFMGGERLYPLLRNDHDVV